MELKAEPFPRPEWSPLPSGDGVVGKVLAREWGFFIAMLRFEANGTTQEHPGSEDTVVMCLEGEGWTSVGGERTTIKSGELVRWPKNVAHRLWTDGAEMTTLMFERLPEDQAAVER